MEYIRLNPARRGLVKPAAAWKWSSAIVNSAPVSAKLIMGWGSGSRLEVVGRSFDARVQPATISDGWVQPGLSRTSCKHRLRIGVCVGVRSSAVSPAVKEQAMNRYRLTALLILLLLFASAARAQSAKAQLTIEASGLEYDDILYSSADVAAHPPGSFDTDLTAIKAAALNGELGDVESRKRMVELLKEAGDPVQRAAMLAVSKIPVFGTLGLLVALNAERVRLHAEGTAMIKSMVEANRTEQRLGKWYHVVYLNGWTRREDVANQTVLIVKPDKNERIYLDLALQHYHKAPATDSPRTEASTRAMICAPSATVDRGAQALDGITTEIFQTTFNASQSSATITRYESSYTEPPKRTVTGDLIPFDCPAGTAHTGPPMPTDRVALYQTVTVTYGATVMSTLDEIGNIKQGDEDKALFEVPSGFKEVRPGDWRHGGFLPD